MILTLLALAAAQAAVPASSDEAQYRTCAAMVKSDAKRAADLANDWRIRGGGIYAKQCLGLAYAALERWEPAAVAFEQAAREADSKRDPRRGDFWAQAGNARLAGDDPAGARAAFDAALVDTTITPALRGEIHLDRARAGVALGDLAAARADLDKGLELVPGDAFGWYLSAALAMRQEAIGRAQQDIAKAVQLAPDDADVLLLAGNVAGVSGEVEAARGLYERAIKIAPDSAAAKSARAAIAANSGAGEDAAPAPPARP